MSTRIHLLLPLVLALPAAAHAQAGIDIKPGDNVNVATGQGFVLAVVIGRDQHIFNVRIINGPAVFKRYPAEVRRRADGMVPMQMTFRSGKVTISIAGDTETGDCQFADEKLYLAIPGEEGLMELDLNDDGSLQGPFGELQKKGK